MSGEADEVKLEEKSSKSVRLSENRKSSESLKKTEIPKENTGSEQKRLSTETSEASQQATFAPKDKERVPRSSFKSSAISGKLIEHDRKDIRETKFELSDENVSGSFTTELPRKKKFSVSISEPQSERRMSRKFSKSPEPTHERRLSKVVIDFIKQRRPTEEKLDLPEVDQEHSDVIEFSPSERRSVSTAPRRSSRYSKVIEGLEQQRDEQRKSVLLRSDTDSFDSIKLLQEKKLRFEEAPTHEMDTFVFSTGMRVEFKLPSTPCDRFLKYEIFAQVFVDEIIEQAQIKSSQLHRVSSLKIIEGIEYQDESIASSQSESLGTYVCVFEWPTIESFNIEIGLVKINEYVSFWEFKENWKYCINYVNGESDEACDFYHYEAIFSIPCKQYPIPQATASIYFTIEVSRVKPKQCFVEVYYCFEGRRLLHSPAQYKIQESWLFHIIDAKLNFYKTLNF